MKYIGILFVMLFLGNISITSANTDEWDMRICTMEYAPVCGENGITYGNSCMAGDNPIAYAGECSAVYTNSLDFLKAEGSTCKQATDGCNRVSIMNWALWAMTEMYCEDIYGEGWQEQWSCLDKQNEEDTIGFLSQNDRNYYTTLQSRITESEQNRVVSIISSYGDKILEKYSWNTEKSVKKIESTVSFFENAISELALKTPADAAMSDSDTQKYSILQYAKFELQIMMNRWMKNAGM